MSMTRRVRSLAAAGLPLALLLAVTPACFGQAACGQPSCEPSCCNIFDCPSPYKHCEEGPPRICVQFGCPKPVCCPSDAPNWGYYPTCWRPWPWAPSWSHCYGNPPAAQIVPPMAYGGNAGGIHPTQLPPPRHFEPAPSTAPRPGL